MIVDCHVHACVLSPEHGGISDRLRNSLPFRLSRWLLGLQGADDAALEASMEARLARTVADAAGLDAAVILAFDAVHDASGARDPRNTHLYVKNDYVAGLTRKYPKMLFGASIHPHRRDAVEELERCAELGAVLVKWLPIVQGFNPADPRCYPFYDTLARLRIPLLAHTGGETFLPNLDPSVADPDLLRPALERGVTVIAAHCGTRSRSTEPSYLSTFVRLARRFENFYGDTSALNLPMRWYAYRKVLADPEVRRKLVHGSDWPVMPVPPPQLGLGRTFSLLVAEKNWLVRDMQAKRELGLDDDYWHRGATLLRLPAAR
jgi:predicted TIM-barrel fold metal-dependent hydrolase